MISTCRMVLSTRRRRRRHRPQRHACADCIPSQLSLTRLHRRYIPRKVRTMTVKVSAKFDAGNVEVSRSPLAVIAYELNRLDVNPTDNCPRWSTPKIQKTFSSRLDRTRTARVMTSPTSSKQALCSAKYLTLKFGIACCQHCMPLALLRCFFNGYRAVASLYAGLHDQVGNLSG